LALPTKPSRPRQKASPAKPVTISGVLEMLRVVHKRRIKSIHWLYNSDWISCLTVDQILGLESLVININGITSRRQTRPMPSDMENMEKLTGDGQKAVNTLRRVLPLYIKHLCRDAERGPNALLDLTSRPSFEQEWRDEKARAVQAYTVMLSALLDLEPKDPQQRASWYWRRFTSWRNDAIEIFELYEQVMGKASMSKNGPAVRFVQSVFARVGDNVECGAIEAALKRSRQKPASRAAGTATTNQEMA